MRSISFPYIKKGGREIKWKKDVTFYSVVLLGKVAENRMEEAATALTKNIPIGN